MAPKETSICADIFTSAWNHAFPSALRNITIQEFSKLTEDELIFIAQRNHIVIGFISLYEPDSFIHHLFIDPTFHRQGVGSKLLNKVILESLNDELTLKCYLNNHKALSFYQAHKFKETDETDVDKFGRWIKLKRNKHRV